MIHLRMMKAILFDLDETLLDRATSVENYIRSQHLRYKLEHIAYELYRDRFIELDQRGYADKQKIFHSLVKEFSLSISVEELLLDFQCNAWKNCKTFEGAAEVLQELRARGYKLGIITNGSVASQSVKLAESGLQSLVDIALISEQEQLKKPDPIIFQRAAEKLNVPITQCIFVGDNPVTDMAGASRTGMRTVWFKGYQTWPDDLSINPDYTVNSLAELLKIEF